MHNHLSDLLVLRILSAGVLLVMLVSLNRRIHRAELSFSLGVVWSLALSAALLLSIAPGLLLPVTRLFGAELPVHFLFFAVQFFLVLLTLGLTLKSARQEQKVTRLTQEIALLQFEVEQIQARNDISESTERKRANS